MWCVENTKGRGFVLLRDSIGFLKVGGEKVEVGGVRMMDFFLDLRM